MIPVAEKAEPSWFDGKVRQPGLAFLERHPHQEPRPLWTVARTDLRTTYGSICAYTCRWISDDATVDHFLPKSKFPKLAYDWHNFRLYCNFTNRSKGAKVGLLDPFQIRPRWFAIAFPQCDVVLGPSLPSGQVAKARATIEALKLNAECVVEVRCHVVVAFRDGSMNLDYLRRFYPFCAMEIERQGSASGASDEAGLRGFVASLFRNLA